MHAARRQDDLGVPYPPGYRRWNKRRNSAYRWYQLFLVKCIGNDDIISDRLHVEGNEVTWETIVVEGLTIGIIAVVIGELSV